MKTAIAVKEKAEIARPLPVLVPLIREELEAGDAAGIEHYRLAGEMLIEAKAQVNHGEWGAWVTRNFNRSQRQAQMYMRLAEASTEKRGAARFSTLREFRREIEPTSGTGKTAWHEPVQKIVNRVDTETLNLKREELKRAEERDAQRTLALQLIDIGYKILARKLHPDKGGSREAMSRLNAVRDRLKNNA